MKNKGNGLTGVLLGLAGILGLILPTWTATYVGYYSYSVLSFSPLTIIFNSSSFSGSFEYVVYLSAYLSFMTIIASILCFVYAAKNKDENSNVISKKLEFMPGAALTLISFIYMIIGFAACGTYSSSYVAIPYGEIWFGMVLTIYIIHLILTKSKNDNVGPMIVNGQSRYTTKPVSSSYGSSYNSANNYQNQSTYQTQTQQQTTTSTPATKDKDGKVYGNLVGAQRVLDVYEDRVVLTQVKNLRSLITHDFFNGVKELPFAMISSIQFKPASKLILGFIQFEVPGVRTGSNFGSENSWTFDESLNQVAQTVAEYCKKQVINYHKPQQAQVVNQVSAADELKKFKELLDMGVITQEEFDAKKKELLGI